MEPSFITSFLSSKRSSIHLPSGTVVDGNESLDIDTMKPTGPNEVVAETVVAESTSGHSSHYDAIFPTAAATTAHDATVDGEVESSHKWEIVIAAMVAFGVGMLLAWMLTKWFYVKRLRRMRARDPEKYRRQAQRLRVTEDGRGQPPPGFMRKKASSASRGLHGPSSARHDEHHGYRYHPAPGPKTASNFSTSGKSKVRSLRSGTDRGPQKDTFRPESATLGWNGGHFLGPDAHRKNMRHNEDGGDLQALPQVESPQQPPTRQSVWGRVRDLPSRLSGAKRDTARGSSHYSKSSLPGGSPM